MSGGHTSLPNRNILIAFGLISILLLNACGNVPQAMSSQSVMNEVQTAVAATVAVQASATASPTTVPTSTVITSTPYPTLTPTSTSYTTYPIYSNCYDSEYVDDTNIPDGTILAPGQEFVKTWEFENTGTCSWDNDFLLVFVHGDEMNGSEDEIGTTAEAGEGSDISVYLRAPNDEGEYTGYWSLADSYGNTFGERVYVEIVVSDAVTSTPTPTSTPTQIVTPTATNTTTTIYTPTPTGTVTPTLTPTPTGTSVTTDTPTPTPTPAPTDVPVSTDTPTPTPTLTPDN